MIIDDNHKELVVATFQTALKLKEDAADLNAQSTDQLKQLADQLQTTPDTVKLAFKQWVDQFKKKKASLEEALIITEAVSNPDPYEGDDTDV